MSLTNIAFARFSCNCLGVSEHDKLLAQVLFFDNATAAPLLLQKVWVPSDLRKALPSGATGSLCGYVVKFLPRGQLCNKLHLFSEFPNLIHWARCITIVIPLGVRQ